MRWISSDCQRISFSFIVSFVSVVFRFTCNRCSATGIYINCMDSSKQISEMGFNEKLFAFWFNFWVDTLAKLTVVCRIDTRIKPYYIKLKWKDPGRAAKKMWNILCFVNAKSKRHVNMLCQNLVKLNYNADARQWAYIHLKILSLDILWIGNVHNIL